MFGFLRVHINLVQNIDVVLYHPLINKKLQNVTNLNSNAKTDVNTDESGVNITPCNM